MTFQWIADNGAESKVCAKDVSTGPLHSPFSLGRSGFGILIAVQIFSERGSKKTAKSWTALDKPILNIFAP